MDDQNENKKDEKVSTDTIPVNFVHSNSIDSSFKSCKCENSNNYSNTKNDKNNFREDFENTGIIFDRSHIFDRFSEKAELCQQGCEISNNKQEESRKLSLTSRLPLPVVIEAETEKNEQEFYETLQSSCVQIQSKGNIKNSTLKNNSKHDCKSTYIVEQNSLETNNIFSFDLDSIDNTDQITDPCVNTDHVLPQRKQSLTFLTLPDPVLENNQNALIAVKNITDRLKLNTRRPSLVHWKENHNNKLNLLEHDNSNKINFRTKEIEKSSSKYNQNNESHRKIEESSDIQPWLTREKMSSISTSLKNLKNDLREMAAEDERLASVLMRLRRDIQQLKLHWCYALQRDMLDDARQIVDDCKQQQHEALHEALQLSETPDSLSPTLRNCGVTRMNITRRRFSVF